MADVWQNPVEYTAESLRTRHRSLHEGFEATLSERGREEFIRRRGADGLPFGSAPGQLNVDDYLALARIELEERGSPTEPGGPTVIDAGQ